MASKEEKRHAAGANGSGHYVIPIERRKLVVSNVRSLKVPVQRNGAVVDVTIEPKYLHVDNHVDKDYKFRRGATVPILAGKIDDSNIAEAVQLFMEDLRSYDAATEIRVDKRRKAGQLFAVELPRGYCYPAWQLTGKNGRR